MYADLPSTITPETAAALGSIARTLDTAAKGLSAVRLTLDNNADFAASLAETVKTLMLVKGRVAVAGVGKSGHIGRKISATLSSTGTPSFFIHPTEASHGDLGMITPDDIVLALSWSGETAEMMNLLRYCISRRISVVGMTADRYSTLARNAVTSIVLPPVEEAGPHGLAPTASSMVQLAVGDAIAVALQEQRGFTVQNFRSYHPGGALGLKLTPVEEVARLDEDMPLIALGSKMAEAVIEMSEKGAGVVGVVGGGGVLLGVITDGDLRRHMSKDLMQRRVEEVMSRRPKTISRQTMAGDALFFMQEEKITALFLVEDRGIPTGLVSIHDLLRVDGSWDLD